MHSYFKSILVLDAAMKHSHNILYQKQMKTIASKYFINNKSEAGLANLFMVSYNVVFKLVLMCISLSTVWVWTDMIVLLRMCFHMRSKVEIQGEGLHKSYLKLITT